MPKQAAQPTRRSANHTPRVMVNVHMDADKPSAPAAGNKAETHANNQSFTNEQLLDAWQAYIDQHPHEHLVINTMRTSKPNRLTDTQLEITVQNIGQVNFINNALPHILDFLRNKLANDAITIDIKLDESMPAPKILTERELIEDIKTRRPEFNDFLEDFKLTLT